MEGESENVNTEQEASQPTQDEGEELVTKRNATSVVWTGFAFRVTVLSLLFLTQVLFLFAWKFQI